MVVFLCLGLTITSSCSKEATEEIQPTQEIVAAPDVETLAAARRLCCPGCDITLTIDTYGNEGENNSLLHVYTADRCDDVFVVYPGGVTSLTTTIRIKGDEDGPVYVRWYGHNGIPARLTQFDYACPDSYSLSGPTSVGTTPKVFGDYLMCTPWEGGGSNY